MNLPLTVFFFCIPGKEMKAGQMPLQATGGVAQREPKSVTTDGPGPAPQEAVVSKEEKSLINGCRSEPIPPSQGDPQT